MKITGPSGACN